MAKKPHYFVALRLPIEVKLELKELMEHLKELQTFSRWEHHEDLHLTLAFLGEADEKKLQFTSKMINDSLQGMDSFPLAISGFGIFGRMDSPRVLWADVLENDSLLMIRERVFRACEQAGFELESRPFRPHITFARKWSGNTPFSAKYLEEWSKSTFSSITFDAKEIVLFKTDIDKLPKYQPVQFFVLGNLS